MTEQANADHPQEPGTPLAPRTLAEGRRRRIWPWMLGLLALLVLGTAATGAVVLMALADALKDSFTIVVNGQHWEPGAWGGDLLGLALAGAGAALVVLLLVLLLVPAGLLVGLAAAALGVGVALLAVLSAVAAALSPLWLLVLLLWWLLRKRGRGSSGTTSPPSGPAATMVP